MNTAEFSAAKVVVAVGHHAAQVFSHQFRVFAHRLGERAENHAGLGQAALEGGGHRYAVEYCVHGHTRQPGALVQRDAELVVSFEKPRIDFVQALGRVPGPDRAPSNRKWPGNRSAECSVWPSTALLPGANSGRPGDASRAGTPARPCARKSPGSRPHPAPAAGCRTRYR